MFKQFQRSAGQLFHIQIGKRAGRIICLSSGIHLGIHLSWQDHEDPDPFTFQLLMKRSGEAFDIGFGSRVNSMICHRGKSGNGADMNDAASFLHIRNAQPVYHRQSLNVQTDHAENLLLTHLGKGTGADAACIIDQQLDHRLFSGKKCSEPFIGLIRSQIEGQNPQFLTSQLFLQFLHFFITPCDDPNFIQFRLLTEYCSDPLYSQAA